MTKLGEVLIGVDKLIASESVLRECNIWKASDGKIYLALEDYEGEDAHANNEYRYHGPFEDEGRDGEEAWDAVIRNGNEPNPGGSSYDGSGKQPPADVERNREINQSYYNFYTGKAYSTPKFAVDESGYNQGKGGQSWARKQREKEQEMGVKMFGRFNNYDRDWRDEKGNDKRHTYDTKYGKIQYKEPQSQAKAEQDAATLVGGTPPTTPSKTKTTPSYVKPYDTPTKKTKKTKRRKRKRKKKLTPEEQTARDTKYSERARKAWKSRKRKASGVESLLHGMDDLIESYAKEVSVTWSENLTPLLMKWYVDHGHVKPSKQEQYAYFLGLSNHYKNEVSRINGRLVMNMWDQQNEIDFMVQFEDKNSAQRWMSKISTPHASKVKLNESGA